MQNKKNIALIIGQLSLGGSEKQLYLLAKGLHRTGRYHVHVIVLSDITEPYGALLSSINLPIITLKQYLHYFDIFRIFLLRKIIKKNRINILYSFSLTANFYSYFACLYLKGLLFISGSRNVESDRAKFLHTIDDYIIRHSNALITNSQENLDYLKKQSKHPENINGIVIRNAIDMSRANNLYKQFNNKKVTIGTIALFKEQKNYPLFIELSKSFAEKNNIKFKAVGTGAEFSKMVAYAKEIGCNAKIEFLGERRDAMEIMAKEFDIFVLTSKREGLPNAIMEAMSVGLPVVATNVGGVSELVQHRETGFLVPSRDLEGLKKYCCLLIKDSELRKTMGKKGKAFIKDNFSVEKMVKEFEKVFDDVMIRKKNG